MTVPATVLAAAVAAWDAEMTSARRSHTYIADARDAAVKVAYEAGRTNATAQWSAAHRLTHAALIRLPQVCPYHGQRFDHLGMEYGAPRCDSCKTPYAVKVALDALDQVVRDGL